MIGFMFLLTFILLAFAAGLALGAGFIIGFKSGVKYNGEGKFIGRVETVDPIQVTDRMVRELEEEESRQDAIR